ncbi:MAG: UDP-N-acetylmuramoyl-L-alanyl-D-glutamate--2,6-diaminopimelate ligase [Candidatus Cloacimonetes bacterium]|nr:UDP-N-acetylmuramoyl-L-alanyl-D-glutamate--2,6-diaminopimelate ligase [Candidatus Cloacimonadota bacterium]
MISQLLELYRQHNILLQHTLADSSAPLPQPRTDNRDLQAGDVFIAIKGGSFDAHDFIPEAQTRGAAFCIGETGKVDITVSDSRKAAALYAKLYYDDPSHHMTLYGITGTNGKTTSSLMLYQMLLHKDLKAAWIGTSGYKIMNDEFPTQHTTPDILQLNQIFYQMKQEGVTHVVMEVSSHALALDRVYGVEYDYCLFTNLSRDHLDFHRNMDEYYEAKYLLFERAALAAATCIINSDDSHGQTILQRLAGSGCKVISVGHDPSNTLTIQNQQTHLHGSSFELHQKDSDTTIKIDSPLIGDFNIDNLALACATILQCDTTMSELPALCQKIKAVHGRIEPVPNQLGLGIYIDYAHTPDAITNLLKSVQKLAHKRVITIIGAGGNRDKGKRPLMLKAALSLSDVVIITDDNPRNENPDRIIYEIVKETDFVLPWWIIRDRAEAIRSAIRLARPEDIVLICGKGHETYQEIQGKRHDFDDYKVALHCSKQQSSIKSEDELILALDPLLIRILNKEEPLGEDYTAPQSYYHISTDSRNIKPASVFFALKGENFDGNHFVPEILADQSNLAVSEDSCLKHRNLIQAKQTEVLMAKILQKYLQLFDIYKIALTGSTGKTCTKELMAQVFESQAPVLKTQDNENNIIGLCKTILRVSPQHKYGIFEIGTNHFGEIAVLSDTIMPDAGIILNIGPSHLEYFGDEEGVLQEKSHLFHRALELRVYPADDLRFERYKDKGSSVGFAPAADYQIQNIVRRQDYQEFTLAESQWQIPYQAPHYVINTSFVIATALQLGLSAEQIQNALSLPINLDLRMQIENRAGRHLILDCYNANPVSMQSALEFWRDYLPQLPHIAILGDMLELGKSSEMYHQMIGAIAQESGEHTLYTVGNHAGLYHNRPENHYANVTELLAKFPRLPQEAVILVKGSHGIHLEKILPLLRGEN